MVEDSLLLQTLRELRDAITSNDARLGSIETKLVGQERCTKIMENYENRMRDTENFIILQSETNNKISTEHQLLIDEMKTVKADVQNLNDKARLVDLTWKTVKSNNVFMTFVIGGIAALVGIYWGRCMELAALYGDKAVIIGAIIVILAVISAYISRHRAGKVAEAIKKYLFWI